MRFETETLFKHREFYDAEGPSWNKILPSLKGKERHVGAPNRTVGTWARRVRKVISVVQLSCENWAT
jgi:hypothetical protein